MIRPTSRLALTLLLAAACGGEKNQGAPSASTAPGQATSGSTTPGKPGEPPPARAPSRGPEAPVFDLGDNRLLAHVQRGGGVVVLLGHPGAAKYLRYGRPKLGWKLGQRDGAEAVAIADLNAQVEVPLTAQQVAAGGKVAVRVDSPTKRRMTVIVNGKAAGTAELQPGWQTVAMAIPAGAAVAGENLVQLAFAKGANASVAWIQLGGEPGPDAAPPLWDKVNGALELPEGGGLAYYVQVPKDGRLTGDVGPAGCQVAVTVAAQDGAPVTGTLEGLGAAVELGALAGKVARLDLTSAGCPHAALAHAALVVPGEKPVVKRPSKPKYVVLWIMDSLRADRVKPWMEGARPEVPVFEQLAKEGTVFRNNYVQGNESQASHASIWTGLYVGLHRMIPGGVKAVEAKWETLDESAKRAGLWTSGVSSNGYIHGKKGFGTTWDKYRNHIHDGGGVRGEDILKYGLESIAGKKEPWLLYLGTVDTHVSWRAKEPWISRYDKDYKGKYVKEASGADVEKMATGKMAISDRDKQRIIAIYDSNVSYQDDLLGKLIEKLKADGQWADTMLIVTADHGDEQWEDGRVGHGGSLRETLIRVPLLVVYPPLFPPGTVVEGTETIDILPTILDALGVDPAPEMQGQGLVALAQGVGRGYPRPSIASQYEFAHAMRLAGWKVRVAGSGIPQLFHVETDPLETKDLVAERPLERRLLADALSTFLVYQKDWKKPTWGVASNHAPGLADRLEAGR